VRLKNTVIMAVVALLLGGYVWFFEIRGREEREEAERVASRLLRFESDSVTGLTLQTDAGTVELSRVDDAWRITTPYDLPADGTAIDSIVNRLQSADHERLIEEQPEDLARFGLAEPEVKVTLQLEGGGARTLSVGAGTPVGFNVFVQPGEGEAVYTTAASLKDALDKTLFDLRDRKILSFTDADVARLQIEAEGLEAAIRRGADQGDGTTRWELNEPLAARGDNETISSLLTRLRNDRALAYPTESATAEELAAWGLDDPAATITIWTAEDAAQTLQIGAESEEPAGHYARRLGSDAVFVVPAALVDAVPDSVDDLRNKTVMAFARDRVESIAVSRSGESIELVKDGLDWRIEQPRELQADTSTVAALLGGALALRAQSFATGERDDPRFDFDDPFLRVRFGLEPAPGAASGEAAEEAAAARTVTLSIGAPTEIEGEDDDDEQVAARYAVVEGEPAVYVVPEAELDDLEVDLFELRSKTLVSFDQAAVDRIELTAGGTTHELAKDAEGAWSLVAPATAAALDSEVNDVLWNLNYLGMEAIVAEWDGEPDVDLGAYGLDAPVLAVRAFAGDELLAGVSIGASAPPAEAADRPGLAVGEETYALVDGVAGLFRITARLRDAVRNLAAALS
jgi:hypothetical protein